MRSARLVAFVSILAPTVLAFAGCTFGLGEYPVRSDALGIEDPSSDGSDNGDGSPSLTGLDSAIEQDSAPAIGPCTDSTPRACTQPDSDAGDAGLCSGQQKCTLGAWGACVVSKKCPATWTENTAFECRKTDVIGDSLTWTQSPAASSDQVLWAVNRATSFDTYGQNDQFCFIPKQTGNCYTTTATAVEVVCTNSKSKLSGDNFENGNIHNTRYCLDRAGPNCEVVDKTHLVWNAGALPCERSFVSAAFTVSAAPRCTSW